MEQHNNKNISIRWEIYPLLYSYINQGIYPSFEMIKNETYIHAILCHVHHHKICQNFKINGMHGCSSSSST